MTTEKRANKRIRLLLACFVLVFAAALGRAAWLQVVHAATLNAAAQRMHEETTTTAAGRGSILDRSGLELAIGEQTTTIYADPTMVTQPQAIATAAHRLLGVDPNTLYPELIGKHTHFVYVARFADAKAADAFLAKRFIGIDSYPEEKRAYPQASVGAQVVGFAGTDDRGLGGLELEYDSKLAGKPGRQTIVRDPAGRAIDVLSSTPEREGHDVFTTIDSRIQANAESVLRQTVHDWGARSATAIVLDPHSGAVLAMAQAPGYNANNASDVPLALQRNRAVTDTYEPGSVFKLVTVAGAMSDGLVKPSTTFTLNYSISVADRVIHDAELRGTETMSVAQILARSSNVGAITIAEKLGPTELMRWIGRFGFGSETGIDFPGESPGQVLPLDQWSGSTIGNVPIGQGIAVTPMQVAAAYGAIANGGVWVQPHLVDRIGGRTQTRFRHRRVVSPAVDAALKTMLTGVVDEHGATGNAAAIPGYTVAGKTGTAQVPGPHGYTTGKYVASFVGMVPVKKPRLLVLVVVDDPTRNIFGGVIAAPAFAQIAKFDLQYLNIPPDAPVQTTTAP
jgi:cell division protein FtsI (penicillin-binding protein 3)/stage V sporulation protein D (sporulation-specific penicillin-binding protein)